MLALAAAAVVRAGDPRLDPWLGFHRRVGVERFFLYATGGGAVPEAADITAVARPFERPHRPAWDHCLFHHGAGAAWLAFLATDEFLFATDGEDLRMALAAFGRTPAVGVGRLLYGPQGRPGPLLRHAVRRASSDIVLALPAMLRSPGLDAERHESYRPLATRVAFVVQPARTHACRGRYDFAFRDEELAMTEEGGRSWPGGRSGPASSGCASTSTWAAGRRACAPASPMRSRRTTRPRPTIGLRSSPRSIPPSGRSRGARGALTTASFLA